jgi:hypothetical protein
MSATAENDRPEVSGVLCHRCMARPATHWEDTPSSGFSFITIVVCDDCAVAPVLPTEEKPT